jgi:hypothetical protein
MPDTVSDIQSARRNRYEIKVPWEMFFLRRDAWKVAYVYFNLFLKSVDSFALCSIYYHFVKK